MTPWPERLVLLGHSLGHSLSPLFQNAALRAAGIPATYVTLDIPRSALPETIEELHRSRMAGNVTIPYKEAVRDACDRLTDTARRVGAVNTFWTAVDGALVGDNTDVGGFEAAAQELLGAPKEGEVVALLGAGGAAAAVLRALEGWPGCRVRMYARTPARGQELMKRFDVPVEVVDSPERALRDATVVVNATPIGLRDDAMPAPIDALTPGAAVLDLAYRRGGTAFVRAAGARGHRALDGMTMLIEQGALAFERWFGRLPDRDVMWSAVAPHR